MLDDDSVFRALADPIRRHLLDRLHSRNGQTLNELCANVDVSRQAVSKHLAVLESALLVISFRRGREKRHYLNPGPIADLVAGWIGKYQHQRAMAVAELRRALEAEPG
ncbi:ArsR/SmtB family transcription factor [Longimycelium tulufanense]|uniref:ArsR/SmtB family transcription factor n=1 Tax=Longimycelium tulufanense TaxID=907463 RepID=UPI001E3ECF54|nr:metalloregulator ArsR/SmtB family transcription factor [Longimycelium tulufanense]